MPQNLHNNKKLEKRRKMLRQQQTKSEILLWSRLKEKQIGYRFRRQHSIGYYVVDFYCPSLRLIIELDGGIHFESEVEKKDKKREEYFVEKRFFIKRFTNMKVETDLDEVVVRIRMACDELSTAPALRVRPSLSKEGN